MTMHLLMRCKWPMACVALSVLSYFSAQWLHAYPPIGAHIAFSHLFALTFGLLLLGAVAVALGLRLWPTWYRRLATAIAMWTFGAEAVRWVGVVYIVLDKEPPQWILDWFGPPSGATVLGAFLCIAVLAYLDYLVQHGHKRSEANADHSPHDAGGEEAPTAPPRGLEDDTAHVRTRALRYIKEDITNRLKVSIHSARFIDLGIDDAPLATHLPWVYKDSNSAREFNQVEEALVAYHRRLLLLGAPGSGKTTTLLHIAQQLIAEAVANPTAPLPLLVNLSKLKLESSGGFSLAFWRRLQSDAEPHDHRVEQWLVSELTRYPGFPKELARSWVKEGRIAALLDGLDEVDDHYRAELVRVLNATYLPDHPDSVVIVGSRINEYLPLQDRKETRLQLEGAVTLQPLTPIQIDQYLKAAQATGLREALPKDSALYEMARTPLTLSMMTLAYGASAPPDVAPGLSLTERRHHLMAVYVHKMLQRKERRDRDIPFDEDTDKEVPVRQYSYSPEKVHRYLGWLALRISVRMQTAFSLDQFYSFLVRNIERDQRSAAWWAAALTRGSLVFIGAILAGWAVGPMTTDAWFQIAAIGFVGALACVPGAWLARSDNEQSRPVKAGKYILRFIGLAVIVVSSLGVGSLALSDVVPFGIPPIPAGMIGICLGILGALSPSLIFSTEDNDRTLFGWLTGVTIVALCTSLFVRSFGTIFSGSWYIPAVALMGSQVVVLCIAMWKSEGLEGAWLPAVGYAVLVYVQSLAVWLVEPLGWKDALIAIVLVTVLLGSIYEQPQLLIGLGVSAFVLGGMLGGVAEAVLGAIVIGYLMLLLVQTTDVTKKKKETRIIGYIHSLVESVTDWCEKAGDRYWLSHVLRRVVSTVGCLPLRMNRFFRYSEHALLLKRSGNDIEFVHRMLRDYFALRDLQPHLHGRDSRRRLEAIRSLGFQGDAAIDALAEFSQADDPDVREAAVWALGRIASPAAVPYIEAALRDESPRVRCTAIRSAKNHKTAEFYRLLSLVVADEDESVQHVLLETALDDVQVRHSTYLDASYRTGKYLFLTAGELLSQQLLERIKGSAELRRYVFELARDCNSNQTRRNAVEIIRILEDKEGVPALMAALADRRFIYREHAAEVLGIIKDPRAIGALTAALRDPEEKVRSAAAVALQRIGTPEALAGSNQPPKCVPRWRKMFSRHPW
jgi:HEAT repeat protein/DNA polymerase III delta prime subunit